MIQGVAAYQYEPDCFQNITYKHFLNASGSYRQDFNVGDFVQFTGRLVCSERNFHNINKHTCPITHSPYYWQAPKSCLTFGFSKLLIMNIMLLPTQQQASGNILVREEDTRLINATNKLTSDLPFLISDDFIEILIYTSL